MGQVRYADQVREHARHEYIEPARRRGDSAVRIVAGDVQKAVRLVNRTALVCQALKSHKFLEENHLALEKWDGPPSGMSTTVTFTYRLTGQKPQPLRYRVSRRFFNCGGLGKRSFRASAEEKPLSAANGSNGGPEKVREPHLLGHHAVCVPD
jgi:hypothetical protein